MQIGRRSGRNMGRGAGIFSKFSHSSGHINFEGGGGGSTSMHGEHIEAAVSRLQSNPPSSAIPKMDKPRRGIRSRASDLPRRTCTRNLSENVGRGGEGETSAFLRLYVSSILHRRGAESRHTTRKGSLQGVEFYFPPGIIF